MTTTAATTEPVRTFSQLRVTDVSYAGGKGANLGELTAAGVVARAALDASPMPEWLERSIRSAYDDLCGGC